MLLLFLSYNIQGIKGIYIQGFPVKITTRVILAPLLVSYSYQNLPPKTPRCQVITGSARSCLIRIKLV